MSTANVEEVLKKIHVVFAKGKSIGGNPDSVVLSKSEMFGLLTELNEAMYAVLDKYEASQRSKEKARLEMERKASEIVIKAKQDADDVHAASILYTDNMLAEISTAISDVTEAMKREYMIFLERMDERQQALAADRDEINAQLSELHDGEFYLKSLEEFRREEAEDCDDEDIDEDEDTLDSLDEGNTRKSLPSRPVRPSKKKTEQKTTVNKEPEYEWPEEEPPAPPVIRVNRPGENSGVEVSTKWNRNKKNKNKKSSTSAQSKESLEEATANVIAGIAGPNGEQLIDKDGKLMASALKNMTPEQLEALEKSIPAYGQGFTADDFPDLDAEYEQFKAEQSESKENSSNTQKKGFKKLFTKNSKKLR